MSADNYFIVKKHPRGGYAAVMGFASDDWEPTVHVDQPQYLTVEDALKSAMHLDSEYGVSVHPEVLHD